MTQQGIFFYQTLLQFLIGIFILTSTKGKPLIIEKSNKIAFEFSSLRRIFQVHTKDSKVKFSGNPASLIIF